MTFNAFLGSLKSQKFEHAALTLNFKGYHNNFIRNRTYASIRGLLVRAIALEKTCMSVNDLPSKLGNKLENTIHSKSPFATFYGIK